jgi:hypothetical protein
MTDPWLKCRPRVTETPLHCYRLRAQLAPGQYVIFCEDEETEESKIGLIIGSDSVSQKFEVNILVPLFETDIPVSKLTHCSIHNIDELVQTEDTCEIYPGDVVGIAFVFTYKHYLLESRITHGSQGISNFYLVRYKTDASPVDEEYLKPFSSLYPDYKEFYSDCYSKRQILFVDRVRSTFSKLLGSAAFKQGSFVRKYLYVTITEENFDYLLKTLGDCSSRVRPYQQKRSKRIVEQGFMIRAIRHEMDCSFVRFESASDLEQLTNVFGEMILYEVRKRRPALTKAPEPLAPGTDSLNVIYGEQYENEHFVMNPRDTTGVDFIFDRISELKIVVRYEKYDYKTHPTTHLPIGCPTQELLRIIQRLPKRARTGPEIDDDEDVKLECEFEHGDTLFRVVAVDLLKKTAEAKAIYPMGKVEVFKFEDIVSLIKERLL